MTKAFLIIFLLLTALQSFPQENQGNLTEPDSSDRKYVVWFSPTKATHVYGVMFELWPREKQSIPVVYGAEFSLMPIALINVAFAPLYFLKDHGKDLLEVDPDSLDLSRFKKTTDFIWPFKILTLPFLQV
jgi:hypothetical protein